jgi:hypothetical protein
VESINYMSHKQLGMVAASSIGPTTDNDRASHIEGLLNYIFARSVVEVSSQKMS